jgi:hypothetical protein
MYPAANIAGLDQFSIAVGTYFDIMLDRQATNHEL